jgi:endonuclease YncB( thermonuclease family)
MVLREHNTREEVRLACIGAPERAQPHRTRAEEASSAEAKMEARAPTEFPL